MIWWEVSTEFISMMDSKKIVFLGFIGLSLLVTNGFGMKLFRPLQCNQHCKQEEKKCAVDCRIEEPAFDRPEVLECFTECQVEAKECTSECVCLDRCAREVEGCNHSCQAHPFRYKTDRIECFRECWYDSKQCTETC